MNNPKLTIITINLNNATGLRKTIESVVSQTYSDFEYIIIDGGSTDGSVEVIKEYQEKITYWVSEPDKGIYNAMNKGILKATGEYCLFLNSGDWLADETVILDFLNANFTDDIISGNIILFKNNETTLIESTSLDNLNFELFYYGSLPHPATFIKRELFSSFGLYNETYNIVSDWEFFLITLIANNCTYNHLKRTITYFDGKGISCLEESDTKISIEREEVFKIHLPLVYKSYKALIEEMNVLHSHEKDYIEYMALKNGKFSFLIRFLLFIKNKRKRYF